MPSLCRYNQHLEHSSSLKLGGGSLLGLDEDWAGGKEYRVMNVVLDFLMLLTIIMESLVKIFIPRRRKFVAGETVLIIGAGHGIGRQSAYEFAKWESTLVLWDINKVMAIF